MKLDQARVALRPRTTLEIFDLGLRVTTGPAARINAKLAALILAPAWALTVVARWVLAWGWLEVWALAVAMAMVLQGVFTVAVGRIMFAEDTTLGEVLGQFARRLPAYLGALIATRALIAVSALLAVLLLPLAWVWSNCMYVHEACLLERAGPIAAVKRSAALVKGNVLAAGLMLLCLCGATGVSIYAAEAFINVGLLEFVLQVGLPFGSLVDEGGSAAALLGLFAVVPYWAAVRFGAYVDLRTRSDGWDIQVRFLALANADQDRNRDDLGGPA